ncbi:MAG: hypothetical protein U9Q03_04250 [Patescibacteria group bacterium]|nr:hypothetical protein [Patescibacteria group bacterium]
MTVNETSVDAIVYTDKDIKTYLSHLAHWYLTDRSREQDILRYPTVFPESEMFHLRTCRNIRGYNREYAAEFSRREVMHMFRRLRRRRKAAEKGPFIIRPKRLIAAMRAIRTKRAKKTENRPV